VAYLVDTSILVRLANSDDAQHAITLSAVLGLHRRGETLHVTPQVLIEFRNVATRPTNLNGLGLPVEVVENQTALFEAVFPLLEEGPHIFPAWKSLVHEVGVIGKQVHDVRLVSVCQTCGVSHLLTFNDSDFKRFVGFVPKLVVVNPKSI